MNEPSWELYGDVPLNAVRYRKFLGRGKLGEGPAILNLSFPCEATCNAPQHT